MFCVYVCVCVCVCVCVRSNQSASKTPYYMSELSKIIESGYKLTPLSAGKGGGGVESPTKCSKRGGFTGCHFFEGGC